MNIARRLCTVLFVSLMNMAFCIADEHRHFTPSLLPLDPVPQAPGKPVAPEIAAATPVVSPVTGEPLADNSAARATPSVHANKTTEQLLAELHDVHAPAEPSWWPLAPGWWFVGVSVLVGICLLCRWLTLLFKAQKKLKWKKSAFNELARLRALANDKSVLSTEVIAGGSVLMRRVSLALLPRRQIASLADDDWLNALDGIGDTSDYSEGVGRLLTRHPYMRPHDINDAEVQELLQLMKKTISHAPVTMSDIRASNDYVKQTFNERGA